MFVTFVFFFKLNFWMKFFKKKEVITFPKNFPCSYFLEVVCNPFWQRSSTVKGNATVLSLEVVANVEVGAIGWKLLFILEEVVVVVEVVEKVDNGLDESNIFSIF